MQNASVKFRIESVADVTRIAAAGSKQGAWYRGHGDADWPLLPHVHRDEFPEPIQEHLLAQTFRSHASPLMPNAPKVDEPLEWLYIMQHHGLPTRLLDWTCSPLIAAFFVVWNSDRDGIDGCLWQLLPATMNDIINGSTARLGKGDPTLNQIVSNAFAMPAKRNAAKTPHLAMNSSHIDQRQMLQQSEFTIHDTRDPLHEHERVREFAIKYVVPKSAKLNLRTELRALGVNRHSMFPDLANIALSITDDVRNPVRATVGAYIEDKKREWAAVDVLKALAQKVREEADKAASEASAAENIEKAD